MNKFIFIVFLLMVTGFAFAQTDKLTISEEEIAKAKVSIRIMTDKMYSMAREDFLREVDKNAESKKNEWFVLYGLLKHMSSNDESYKSNEKYAIYKFFSSYFPLLPTEPENFPLEVKNLTMKCLDNDFSNYNTFSMAHLIQLIATIGQTEDFTKDALEALGKIILHTEIRRQTAVNPYLQNAFSYAAETILPLATDPKYKNSDFVGQIVIISEKTEWGTVQTRRIQTVVSNFKKGKYLKF